MPPGLRLQLPLKVVQLLHEVEVGRDVGLARPHQVEGVVQAERHLVHEVGDGDGDRPTHTGEAVDQDALLVGSGFICNRRQSQ